MRKSIFILISVFVLSACNNSKNSSTENTDKQTATEQTNVGGEKDEHGCLTAAGETWSQLKQNCVQIFSVGQRLNPIETKSGEAVVSAFILFNDDKTEAELFLPSTKSTSILKSSDKEIYENGAYKFDTKDTSLYINGTKSYSSENAK